MSTATAMDGFLDALLTRMTLKEKIGQLNYPSSSGIDTTGVGQTADSRAMIRRGEICGVSEGADVSDRRALQEYAVEHGPNGIPLLIGKDCIQRYKTGGPIPLALSMSWDLDLIRRINEMTAREARADGVNINWAPMLDICYDGRWGRIAEGNGEFPYLGARIAEVIVRAYEGADGDLARPDRIMATLKHFMGYGLATAGRDYSAVEASISTLYRVMEPFKAGIDAGAGAIMVAFNTINDMPATAHRELLQDVLRKRFGFRGIIVTDFTAIDPELVNHGIAENSEQAAYLAFKAGVNVDLVSQAFLKHLGDLEARGRANPAEFDQAEGAFRFGPVTEAEITQRCREVLEAKYRLGLFSDPYIGLDPALTKKVTFTPANIALVREAATKSLVLLKNEGGVLPLKRQGTVALIGPLVTDRVDMQGTWAIDVDPSRSVTLLEGVRAVAGAGVRVLHAKGANIVDNPSLAARLNMHNAQNPSVIIDARSPEAMIAEALTVAEAADVIVLCLGEAKEHAGEASTRADVQIPLDQRPLFDAVAAFAAAAGKPLVLIAMAGRPLALAHEAPRVDALIYTGQLGSQTGNGLADVLFGDVNPSGRLSLALPRSVGQLPYRTEALPTGRPRRALGVDVAGDTEKDRHGVNVFRKFTTACILEEPHTPLYPAGFGLGYAAFEYGQVSVNKTALRDEADVLQVSFTLTNIGDRAGTEVAQLYLRDPVGEASRPVRELKGFERVELAAGATRKVTFRVTTEQLAYYRGQTLSDCVHDWESGDFDIMVGPNCEDVQVVRVNWRK